MDITERLELRAQSYEQSGPSAKHTADLLRDAKFEIENARAEASKWHRAYVAAREFGSLAVTRMETVTVAEAKRRIAEIDKMFEEAKGWGSWMVMCANEREDLVDRLNSQWGESLEHKWQARCGGKRTD